MFLLKYNNYVHTNVHNMHEVEIRVMLTVTSGLCAEFVSVNLEDVGVCG